MMIVAVQSIQQQVQVKNNFKLLPLLLHIQSDELNVEIIMSPSK